MRKIEKIWDKIDFRMSKEKILSSFELENSKNSELCPG